MAREAVNWNRVNNGFTKMFWDQNIRQFWIDEEIPLSDDKIVWMNLNKEEQFVYTRVLGGLTLLDTEQGSVGMPKIALAVDNLHAKAVLGYMGFMEHMHAKSYSSIFSTLCTMQQIDDIFIWVQQHNSLQEKLALILNRYNNINSQKDLYLAMASSVFLETFLFYSGFFYPLYLAGQGKMVNSGEIINLIIRDESVHGVYTGLLAQDVFENLNTKTQNEVNTEVANILEQLYNIEQKYTNELYTPLGLTKEVDSFVQYNADKALMNLALNSAFNVKDEDINAVALRGMGTSTKNHDFFSTKGNGYIKTTKVEKISDEDFNF